VRLVYKGGDFDLDFGSGIDDTADVERADTRQCWGLQGAHEQSL
jgi:hypothetical protein